MELKSLAKCYWAGGDRGCCLWSSKYSVSNKMPSMMRKMPIIIPTRSGNIMTIIPKIMHKTASKGLEIVIPNFFSSFSTIFVKLCSPSYIFLQLHRQPSIFKIFDGHAANGNF
jgi:hypothetical protein